MTWTKPVSRDNRAIDRYHLAAPVSPVEAVLFLCRRRLLRLTSGGGSPPAVHSRAGRTPGSRAPRPGAPSVAVMGARHVCNFNVKWFLCPPVVWEGNFVMCSIRWHRRPARTSYCTPCTRTRTVPSSLSTRIKEGTASPSGGAPGQQEHISHQRPLGGTRVPAGHSSPAGVGWMGALVLLLVRVRVPLPLTASDVSYVYSYHCRAVRYASSAQ